MDEKRAIKLNIRDLSYLRRPDGRGLKKGMFFRSAALRKLKEEDIAFLKENNIKTVIDLRTDAEIHKKPDIVLEGVTYHHIPLLTEETMGITHEGGLKGYKKPPHMPSLYAMLASDEHSVEGIKKALAIILDPKRGGAILWHCTEGKDRGGLVSAMLLLAAGIEEEKIIEDYALSNRRSEKKGRLYRRLIRIFMWNKELATSVYQTMLADPIYLRSSLAKMREMCGDYSTYLKEKLAVTPASIEPFLD